jgi:hypothetical protein
VGINAALLGSGPSLAPGGFNSAEGLEWHVSLPFLLAALHLCASLIFAYSEPPPTTPYPYGICSSSTLTIGQHPYSLRHAVSTASQLTVQVPPQRSNYAVHTLYPEHQDLPSDADHRRSGDQQGGQPNGRVNRRPSRRGADGSEPSSRMPTATEPFDFNTPQNGLAQHQVYGYQGGAGKSRTSLRNTLGGNNSSRRNVSSRGSRELSVRELVLLLLRLA